MTTSIEKAQNIDVRRVKVHSPSQLPADYGTTPGGTMFATTPGGTRIIYDRTFLLECRNSPLAKSPLANLPRIPGVTCPVSGDKNGSPKSTKPPSPLSVDQQQQQQLQQHKQLSTESNQSGGVADDQQFEMDI